MIHADARRRGERVRAEAQRRREAAVAATPFFILERCPWKIEAVFGGTSLCASARLRELMADTRQRQSRLRVSASPREQAAGSAE